MREGGFKGIREKIKSNPPSSGHSEEGSINFREEGNILG